MEWGWREEDRGGIFILKHSIITRQLIRPGSRGNHFAKGDGSSLGFPGSGSMETPADVALRTVDSVPPTQSYQPTLPPPVLALSNIPDKQCALNH